MKVIVNKFIPFPGFIALTFYNIIFWRKEYEHKMNDHSSFLVIYNHESIHEAQMKDFCHCVLVGGTIFYIIYFFEWLYRMLFTKDMFSHNAYRNVSFEQEARKHENDLTYLIKRKRFAFWK